MESYRRISASVVAVEAFVGLFFILIFIRVLCRVVGRSTRESTTISYWPVLATGGRHIENHFFSLSIQSLLNCIFLALSVSRRGEPYKVNGFNFCCCCFVKTSSRSFGTKVYQQTSISVGFSKTRFNFVNVFDLGRSFEDESLLFEAFRLVDHS